MKKINTIIITLIIIAALVLVVKIQNDKNNVVNNNKITEKTETNSKKEPITKELAYEGIKNYCKENYDWSIAEKNPSNMYVEMGEETESEYKVIFRSYTGSFVYFYVNKTNGITRMIDYVPNLKVEQENGNINIYDYIKK